VQKSQTRGRVFESGTQREAVEVIALGSRRTTLGGKTRVSRGPGSPEKQERMDCYEVTGRGEDFLREAPR